jgi:hypothetical protein
VRVLVPSSLTPYILTPKNTPIHAATSRSGVLLLPGSFAYGFGGPDNPSHRPLVEDEGPSCPAIEAHTSQNPRARVEVAQKSRDSVHDRLVSPRDAKALRCSLRLYLLRVTMFRQKMTSILHQKTELRLSQVQNIIPCNHSPL